MASPFDVIFDEEDDLPLTLCDIVAPKLPEAGKPIESKYKFPQIKPPSELIGDDEIYGERAHMRKQAARQDFELSECITFTIKHYAEPKSYSTYKDFVSSNSRLLNMQKNLGTKYPLPVQSHCWPIIDKGQWHLICVSPCKSGKTWVYLMYLMKVYACEFDLSDDFTYAWHADSDTDDDDHDDDDDDDKVKPSKHKTKTNDIDQSDSDSDSDASNRSSSSSSESSKSSNIPNDQELQDPVEQTASPSYIIICDSERKVENVARLLEHIKLAASIHTQGARRPTVVKLTSNDDIKALEIASYSCDVLIATPGWLKRSMTAQCISLKRCLKIFVDDCDQILQLHNSDMNYIAKVILQREILTSDADSEEELALQVCLFSEKWTILLNEFVSNAFAQPEIVFGSNIEAAVYSHVRFDVERCDTDQEKSTKLSSILEACHISGTFIAIACSNRLEALRVSNLLTEQGIPCVAIDINKLDQLPKLEHTVRIKFHLNPIYILSDEIVIDASESLFYVTHLIHFSLPQNDQRLFDTRFRLMRKLIREQASNLVTTIFVSQCNVKQSHDLLDIISRATRCLASSRSELRALRLLRPEPLCWRYASLGVCRLQPLARNDGHGTFCRYRHSISTPISQAALSKRNQPMNGSVDQPVSIKVSRELPHEGQIKIVITEIVNPNEFYFWIQASRNISNPQGTWVPCKYGLPIDELLQKLNDLREKPDNTVSFSSINENNNIFGTYVRERGEVHRVRVLDLHNSWSLSLTGDISHVVNSHSSKIQVQVFHIDYGYKSPVFVKNLFHLPAHVSVRSIKPLALRGFNVGIKPCNNEPDWSYKVVKRFFEAIVVPNLYITTAWIRLYRENCYWLEGVEIRRCLSGISSMGQKTLTCDEPNLDLIEEGLAEKNTLTIPCLNDSQRSRTVSKWRANKINIVSSYAALPRKGFHFDAYLLSFKGLDNIYIRLVEHNERLLALEDSIQQEHDEGLLKPLDFFEPDTICIAEYSEPDAVYTCLNRCKIISLGSENGEKKCRVLALDHSDEFIVKSSRMFDCRQHHVNTLPFQAINTKLDGLQADLADMQKVCDIIMSYARDSNSQNRVLKCDDNPEYDGVILHYQDESTGQWVPLAKALCDTNLVFDTHPRVLDPLNVIDFSMREHVVYLVMERIIQASIERISAELLNKST